MLVNAIPKMSQQIEQIFECAKNDLRESANICVLILIDPMGDDTHFHLWERASLMLSIGKTLYGYRLQRVPNEDETLVWDLAWSHELLWVWKQNGETGYRSKTVFAPNLDANVISQAKPMRAGPGDRNF